jgi:hypothetical protein
VEEGFCALCSVACPVEYRWHGTLINRVTERFTPDGGGTLCRRGRFEQAVLLEASAGDGELPRLDGRPVDWKEAQAALEAALGRARRPLLKISPLLAGEVIDRMLRFARQRQVAAVALGMEGLNREWASFLPAPAGGTDARRAGAYMDVQAPAGEYLFEDRRAPGGPVLLVGNLDESNNVAFTECLGWKNDSAARLWAVGPHTAVYDRHFERVFPTYGDLAWALREAQAAGGQVEVLVNPQEVARVGGKEAERRVLSTLRGGGAARLTLFWNARNGGYLLRSLAASGVWADEADASEAADLVLEAGALEGKGGRESVKAGSAAVRWGRLGDGPDGAGLWIPLPRPAWIGGYTEPSGRRPRRAGGLDGRLLGSLLI